MITIVRLASFRRPGCARRAAGAAGLRRRSGRSRGCRARDRPARSGCRAGSRRPCRTRPACSCRLCLKPSTTTLLDLVERAGQEAPVRLVGAVLLRVLLEHLRRVVARGRPRTTRSAAERAPARAACARPTSASVSSGHTSGQLVNMKLAIQTLPRSCSGDSARAFWSRSANAGTRATCGSGRPRKQPRAEPTARREHRATAASVARSLTRLPPPVAHARPTAPPRAGRTPASTASSSAALPLARLVPSGGWPAYSARRTALTE